jgi:hypothetical protein
MTSYRNGLVTGVFLSYFGICFYVYSHILRKYHRFLFCLDDEVIGHLDKSITSSVMGKQSRFQDAKEKMFGEE